MLNLDTLNTDFGINDHVRFVTGAGGFIMLEVKNAHATALISTYSGHILAYQPISEPEPLLFLSEQANYEQGKAIRGGVPVCWPWFSDDGVPAHGFMRNQQWFAFIGKNHAVNFLSFDLFHNEQFRESRLIFENAYHVFQRD